MSESENHISKKSDEISSFLVMDIMERAKGMERDGVDIVHFGVGEPDFDTPEPIKQAGIAAIAQGQTKYTHSLGLIELRNGVAVHMRESYGVTIDPAQVLVASGTSNALFLSLAALLNDGDEVIMSDPGYACYPNFVSFLGGKPVFVPVTEEEKFGLDPEKIAAAITPKTRAILINSPGNPTGMLLDEGALKEIATLGPLVISDEIYHGLVYEGTARSILEFTDHAIVIDGFSKRYAMTGWRLGYAIVPPLYLRPMQKMQQNFNISANSFVQWAGVTALKEGAPFVEEMRQGYARRRRILLDGLARIGLPVAHEPQGAFYMMVNVKKFGRGSLELAHEILEKARVSVTPGIDFGPGGEGFIRLSYATSEANIEEGLKRLGKFVEELS